MKQKLLTIKSLLVAVLLGVWASNVWAETVTTYNFKLLGPASATFSYTNETTCFYTGSASGTRTFKIVDDVSVGGFPALNGILASYTGDLTVHSSTGIYSTNGRTCAILGLKPGAKVSFEYTKAGSGNDVIQYCTSVGYGYAYNGANNNLEAWEDIASGDEITITHGTYLCFVPKKNVRIGSLTIKIPDDDNEAAANMVAVNNNRYNVTAGETISCGEQVKSVSGITMTYGGLDGTDTWTASATSQSGLTGIGYIATASTSKAPKTSGGSRANSSPNLPAQGNFYIFEPTVNGDLSFAGLFTGSRNTFCVSSDWVLSDSYNPGSNEYGSHTFSLTAGKTYYVWTDNANYGMMAGFTFTPTSITTLAIPTSTYATISSAYALDFANATDESDGKTLIAYTVSALSATSATLTEVTQAPANTGIILMGTAGQTYTIPVLASASDVGTNKLHASVTPTLLDDGTFYVLKGGKFLLVTGATTEAARTVPAGKAYLLASDMPSPAPELTINFGGEATGINEVKGEGLKVNGYYDLQGRKVAQPTKGLYIVNGKKVVIK